MTYQLQITSSFKRRQSHTTLYTLNTSYSTFDKYRLLMVCRPIPGDSLHNLGYVNKIVVGTTSNDLKNLGYAYITL